MRNTKQSLRDALLMVLNLDIPVAEEADRTKLDGLINPEIQARVVGLVNNVRSMTLLLRSLDQAAIKTQSEAIDAALKPINDAFTHCALNPGVSIDMNGQTTKLFAHTDVARGSRSYFEAASMAALHDLIADDALDALRNCGNESCGRWFLASRAKQRWCGQSCRQSAFQKTDDFKAKRRANYQAAKTLTAAKRTANNAKVSK